MLLGSNQPVVTSEITQVEFCSAVARSRLPPAVRDALLIRFASDSSAVGPIALLPLRPAPVLSLARELVVQHHLKTLDAIHLAVALEDGRRFVGDAEFVFVTRDEPQAAAARTLGLTVV